MKDEKRKTFRWKSWFVKLMGMAMLALNVLSAPVAVVGTVTTATITITATAITAVLFVSCDKETEKHQQEQPQPQPQKHNVELVLRQGQPLPRDSIVLYANDPTVDSILLPLERYNIYAGLSANGVENLVISMRECKNIKPEKVFGKGEMQLANDVVLANLNNNIIFLRDTMRYKVTAYNK